MPTFVTAERPSLREMHEAGASKEELLAVLNQEEAEAEKRLALAVADNLIGNLLDQREEDSQLSWPEPLPLVRVTPQNDPFPVEALPSVVQAAVKRAYKVIQAPVDLVCQCFLAAATLAVQPYVDLLIDGRSFPVSNLIYVADTSKMNMSDEQRIFSMRHIPALSARTYISSARRRGWQRWSGRTWTDPPWQRPWGLPPPNGSPSLSLSDIRKRVEIFVGGEWDIYLFYGAVFQEGKF